MRSFAALLLCVACAPQEASTVPPPGGQVPNACGPGEAPLGDGCLAAGMQPNGCAGGEVALDDGSCAPPGVRECAAGFALDGEGCVAILPEAPCAPGLMAVPGETSCRAPAACASIPTDTSTEHVDASYTRGGSDGSPLKPWTTIQGAIDAAVPDAIVAVAAGQYVEDVTIHVPVKLWGECPEKVEIAGTISIAADGTEIHALAVTGSADGIASDAAAVTIDGVWVHHTGGWGVKVVGGSLALQSTLIEGAYERGVYLEGAEAVIEGSVVRDTVPAPAAPGFGGGRAVNARDHLVTGARSTVTLKESVIEGSSETAVLFHESDGAIEASVIRDTVPSLENRFGRCVVAQIATPTPAQLAIRQSVIERCHDGGVVAHGTELTLESTTLRDIEPNLDMGDRGYAIATLGMLDLPVYSSVRVRSSLVERASEAAMFVSASDIEIDGVMMRDTRTNTPEGPGRGVSVQNEEHHGSALTMRQSAIVGGSEVGVFIRGSTVLLEGVAVRDVAQRGDGYYGRGVTADEQPEPNTRPSVTVRWSAFENLHDVGVFCSACDLVVESTSIRDVFAPLVTGFSAGIAAQQSLASLAPASLEVRSSRIEQAQGFGLTMSSLQGLIDATWVRAIEPALDETAGDGISAFGYTGHVAVTVSNSRVEQAARAGLSLWGGEIVVTGTEMSCNAIHLASDPFGGRDGTLVDGGANACGCDGTQTTCKAVSAELEPPQPFSPVD